MHGLGPYLPKEMLFCGMVTEAFPPLMKTGPDRDAAVAYLSAIKAAGVRPDEGTFLAWDATTLVVDALKKYGPSATAEQIRSYIANLHDWVGVHGRYDFRRTPQRGLDSSGIVIVYWSTSRDTWVPVSKVGANPF